MKTGKTRKKMKELGEVEWRNRGVEPGKQGNGRAVKDQTHLRENKGGEVKL